MRRFARSLRRAYECPVCAARVRGFATYAGRPGARCPRCDALERHRHLWLYLERHPELLRPGTQIVHIAPERPLARRLRAVPGVEYLSGDLDPGAGERVLDLRALDLPDQSAGLILCVHVLEHVDDDRRALRELRRVLRPGGTAILQVPRRPGPTVEEEAPGTPAERLARFGQEDHVRVYGDDYEQRLRDAGLAVRTDVFRDQLSPAERRRFGLEHAGAPDPADDRLWEVVRAERPPVSRPAA